MTDTGTEAPRRQTDRAWRELREHLESEVRDYQRTNGKSKDARMVYAALEGAYSGILRKMDRLESEV